MRHRQATRGEHVIAVEPGHDIAADAGKPQIDGIRLPQIACAYPVEGIAIAAQDVDGAIARTAIPHDIGEPRIALIQDAVDGGTNERGLVQNGGYNGNRGQVRGWLCFAVVREG